MSALKNADSGVNLKRKRPTEALPPPSFIYEHSGDPKFNVFHGFLMYPELCIVLASHLPVNNLISLYAISQEFHTIIDHRFTTVILNQATCKAYESKQSFPFRCYAHLCRPDPSARFAHPNPKLASRGMMRMVPSFRWLKFILYREKVIQEVMAIFAERGCPLPPRCSLAMKRMWFLFDIPDNARRIGFIHCRSLFTDLDLHFSMCFIVKLDMLCNDPIAGEKRDCVRKMLLSSQDGFTTIRKVLNRELWRTPVESLKAQMRYGFLANLVASDQYEHLSDVFGVPVPEIGKLKEEYWGAKKTTSGEPMALLFRPDQLIMREAVRRGYSFTKHFLRCLQYGYTKPGSLKQNRPSRCGRQILRLGEEYALNDMVGGVRALEVREGGDTLLDLGNTTKGSKFCVDNQDVPPNELEARREEKERISNYMRLWMEEQKWYD